MSHPESALTAEEMYRLGQLDVKTATEINNSAIELTQRVLSDCDDPVRIIATISMAVRDIPHRTACHMLAELLVREARRNPS